MTEIKLKNENRSRVLIVEDEFSSRLTSKPQ